MNTQSSITSNMPPTRISPPISESIVSNTIVSHHPNPLHGRLPVSSQESHYPHQKQPASSHDMSFEHVEHLHNKRSIPDDEYTSPRDDASVIAAASQPATKSQPPALDANKMLYVYIYDFLRKKHHHQTANQFLSETGLSIDNVRIPIDIQEGFLSEWWTVFWEIFSTRASQGTHMDANQVSYADVLSIKGEFEKRHKVLHNQIQQQQHYIQNISQNGRAPSSPPEISHIHSANAANVSPPTEELPILLDEKLDQVSGRLSPRVMQSDHSTPSSCSSEPSLSSNYATSISSVSMSSSATKELDSLNLEGKRIWLSQLQQRSAAILSSPAMVSHSVVRHVPQSYQQHPSNVAPSPMMAHGVSNTPSQQPTHPSPTKRFRQDGTIEHQPVPSSIGASAAFQQTAQVQQSMYSGMPQSATPVQMVVQHRPQAHQRVISAGQQAQMQATQHQMVYQRGNIGASGSVQGNVAVQGVPQVATLYHQQMQPRPQNIQAQQVQMTGNQNVQVMMMPQQRMQRPHKQQGQSQQMMMVATMQHGSQQPQFVMVPQQQQMQQGTYGQQTGGSPSQVASGGRSQGPMVILNNLSSNMQNVQQMAAGNVQVSSAYSGNQQPVMMHQQQQQMQAQQMAMHQQQMHIQSSNAAFVKAQTVHNQQNATNIVYHPQVQQQMHQGMGNVMAQYMVPSGGSGSSNVQRQQNQSIDKASLEINYFAGLTTTAPSGVQGPMVSASGIEGQPQSHIDDDTIDRIEETLLGDLDDLFSQDAMTEEHVLRKNEGIDTQDGSYS